MIYAATHGYADEVPLERMREWEQDLLRYMDASHPEIGRDILEKGKITDETEEQLKAALDAFMAGWN